jgi:tetratricopeptide (TPR) repeat protein
MKIKFLYKLIIILLAAASFTFSQSEEEKFQQGNNYYRQKEYDKAIEVYTDLINSGYEGSSLYYNLGNAYYRTGKLGYAILYYEKALKLSPGDEDIKHNLALANLKTIDKVESLPGFFLFEWWESLVNLFTTTGWTILTYIFYIILLAAIGSYFFIKNNYQQRLIVITGLVSLILLIFSTIILTIKLNRELNVQKGVVVANTVNVKLSPDSGSNDAFIIHEGIKVEFEDKIDNWVKIRLQDGKVGWIQENDAKII